MKKNTDPADLDKTAHSILEDAMSIAKGYFAEKIRTQNIMNYNGANLAYRHSADMANKLGLGEEQKDQIVTYPGGRSTEVTVTPKQETSVMQKYGWPIATAAAMGAAGWGLGRTGVLTDEASPPPISAGVEVEVE